jgi:hypothetical protein
LKTAKSGPPQGYVSHPLPQPRLPPTLTHQQVTAGLDLTFEFIKKKYENGSTIAEFIAGNTEHTLITDWRDDPWAAQHGVPKSN